MTVKPLAEAREPARNQIGTTLTLHAKEPGLLDLCVKRFPYWLRSVEGLSGHLWPEDQHLDQGGLTREVRRTSPSEKPDWIDSAEIGPPEDLSVWDTYDGKGRVDVLYRGVFVERLEVDQLWALEGAVHVDPKHFRPMLNREGFVGDKLREDLTPFLRTIHPLVLEDAASCITDLLSSRDSWNLGRAITLWLAVPGNANYEFACEKWGREFRERKALRKIGTNGDDDISVADIVIACPKYRNLKVFGACGAGFC